MKMHPKDWLPQAESLLLLSPVAKDTTYTFL